MKDEIECYPKTNSIRPFLINISERPDFIDYLENNKLFVKTTEFLEQEKPIVLQSVLNLRKNFKPDKNGKYSNEAIEGFVQLVSKNQLDKFFNDRSQHIYNTETIDTWKLKSLRSQLLITLWKFYLMKDRKARKSDIFDLTIASSLPYVDLVLTEKNMANDIEQMRKRNLFFNGLRAFSLNGWLKVHDN
ncbi:hypothetical protein [Reichenbachiella sp. MALMAid0571]|uniref:hypothetical protein n=1 Tax=Reichenbachiella sp. MALMAid0571 TaxID=3143939 RepID=UPI0032DEFEF9